MNRIEPRGVVLVVEESPGLVSTMLRSAHRAGFDALEAASAEEALFILKARTDVEAMVIDLRISGAMNGLTFAHLVRDRWPEIELVIFSKDSLVERRYLPERSTVVKMPLREDDLTGVIERKLGRPLPDRQS